MPVVRIPPNVKHWHGAAPTTSMAHISVVEQPANGPSAVWMEKVTPEQYNAPPRGEATSGTAAQPGEQTAAQRIMGDIAPALADLTDRVLFGELWARPQLSQRDRSLVTVSALITMNRPDQLRSHLTRARANGLTQEQAVEVITHLAFYTGGPNAVTAVGVAREVFAHEQTQPQQYRTCGCRAPCLRAFERRRRARRQQRFGARTACIPDFVRR